MNTLVLPVLWYGESNQQQSIVEYINDAFTGIFVVEAFIKIVGLGPHYFKEGWNIFDLIIILGSVASIVISFNTSVNLGGTTSIIRVFRVGRVLRLIKRAKSLKIAFDTFILALPALTNVGGLLFLLLYLYSVLGVYLFSETVVSGVLT